LQYSIIIPAYNESRRIVPTLNKVLVYLAEQGWDAELIVVRRLFAASSKKIP